MSDAAGRPVGLPTSVAQALAQARQRGLDRLDAQLLLGHLLQQHRAWLIAHDDAVLALETAAAYDRACQRRAAGEPLAYLVGAREFHGLRLQVSPAVLVPRPDTETLVDWALALLQQAGAAEPRVLDLGTGSGAIALAVAHHHPSARLLATDLSPTALAQAQANALQLGLGPQLQWAQGGWWAAVPADARFELVLSNPPYIAGDDPHLAALRHEPALALTPGGDGLDALRQIIAGAPAHLAPGAWLLLEHGWDQADAVTTLLHQAGLVEVATRRDIENRPRCSGGRWPGA